VADGCADFDPDDAVYGVLMVRQDAAVPEPVALA
jgi:hypothetical protein